MRALVTGASGFLGRHLCDLLDQVYPERVELRSDQSVDRALRWDPEIVFHLAAMTDPRACEADPQLCYEVNVEGTRRLAQGLRCPLVLVSTVHVYGPPQRLPIAEEHPCRPQGVYARSKLDAEGVAPEAIVARAFNLTGPGQGSAFAPADWARQSLGPGPIRTGDLELQRDYLDVRDAARGLVLLASRGAPGTVTNLCRGEAVSMRWIAEQLAEGRALVEDAERRRPEVPILVGDNRRARALGWAPEIPLERSLRDLKASLS